MQGQFFSLPDTSFVQTPLTTVNCGTYLAYLLETSQKSKIYFYQIGKSQGHLLKQIFLQKGNWYFSHELQF